MKICHRIKLMRLLFGLTQEELASLVSISRPSMLYYEQGGYSPTDQIVIRLADIFGVEPGYLRYGSPIIQSHIWIPNIRKNSKRMQNTINEIENLFPAFIHENRFTSVVSGYLADGSQTVIFGRDSHDGCLLLTNTQLADKVTAATSGMNCRTIEDNLFGTLESFDADCQSFISWQIEKFGLKLDFLSMRQSLTRLTEIKARKATRLDGVTLVHEASINELARQGLMKVADTACRELVGEPLEKFVAGHNITIPDVLTYSDQLSKSLCVILKAACDLLTKERQTNPSFSARQFRMSTIGIAN